MPGSLISDAKDRIVTATTDLFSHGVQPLDDMLAHAPDPGLLGPDSVSWRVIGDASAFVGGIRALIVQTAHPEVVAGVEQHSRYRTDPLGRLTRTSFYVTETTYGALPEVERAVAMVRDAHQPVHGRSGRGRPYSAGNPAMAAWVHNVLTESFLAAYQAYGPEPLSPADADRFVEEQTRIGALLDADPLPTTAAGLTAWVTDHPRSDIERRTPARDRLPAASTTVDPRQDRLPAAVRCSRRHAARPHPRHRRPRIKMAQSLDR